MLSEFGGLGKTITFFFSFLSTSNYQKMSPLQDDRTAELDNMEKKVDDKAFDAKSVEVGQSSTTTLFSLAGLRKALLCTAETRGIEPVAAEERTDKTGRSLITLWFTANCSILP